MRSALSARPGLIWAPGKILSCTKVKQGFLFGEGAVASRPGRKGGGGCIDIDARLLPGLELEVTGHSFLRTRRKPDVPGQLSGRAGSPRQMCLWAQLCAR